MRIPATPLRGGRVRAITVAEGPECHGRKRVLRGPAPWRGAPMVPPLQPSRDRSRRQPARASFQETTPESHRWSPPPGGSRRASKQALRVPRNTKAPPSRSGSRSTAAHSLQSVAIVQCPLRLQTECGHLGDVTQRITLSGRIAASLLEGCLVLSDRHGVCLRGRMLQPDCGLQGAGARYRLSNPGPGDGTITPLRPRPYGGKPIRGANSCRCSRGSSAGGVRCAGFA